MVRFEAYLHFQNVEYRRQSGRNIRLDKVLFAKGVQGDGGPFEVVPRTLRST